MEFQSPQCGLQGFVQQLNHLTRLTELYNPLITNP
jgi:hypothetical protein